ncbi:hypothetical protein [Streptococcus agalactiae]|uniref:hypothetical protein n=1 Tax=Streptococcus agalactiae TaxID=1311 RepID=UPI003C731C93
MKKENILHVIIFAITFFIFMLIADYFQLSSIWFAVLAGIVSSLIAIIIEKNIN